MSSDTEFLWGNIILNMKHFIRKIYTKLRYGVSCCERATPYYFLSKQIYKTLREYKKHMGSYPANMTKDEWDEILNSMIWSFKYFAEDGYEQDDLAQNGLALFAKYFRNLWS